jgi:hypothetical protein
MSWASHNVEQWDELCVLGIARKLHELVKNVSGSEIGAEPLEDVAHALYHETPAQDVLMQWAYKEICAAESDWRADQIDDAYERHSQQEGD